MLATSLVAAVLSLALSVGLLWTNSGDEHLSVAVDPWSVTGRPVKQKEPWRLRVCEVHHRIYIRAPHNPPGPLHAILHLDARASPFSPSILSSSPELPLYNAVHTAILEGFHNRAQPLLEKVVSGREVVGSTQDREWLDIMMSVTSILSDDFIRAEYASHFIPALTRRPGIMDRFKDEHVVLQDRLQALEHLCA